MDGGEPRPEGDEESAGSLAGSLPNSVTESLRSASPSSLPPTSLPNTPYVRGGYFGRRSRLASSESDSEDGESTAPSPVLPTAPALSEPASWIYSNKKWSPADGGAVDPQAVRRMQDLRNLFYVSDLTRFPMFQSFASNRTRLIREGNLTIWPLKLYGPTAKEGKKRKERCVVLYDDYLVVAKQLGTTAKLDIKYLLPLISMTMDVARPDQTDLASQYSFVLDIATIGRFLVSAVSYGVHQAWQTDLRTAVLNRHRQSPRFSEVPGWKHRILRGTLHSAALYADMQAFKAILKKHENRVQIRAARRPSIQDGVSIPVERGAADVDIRYYLDQRDLDEVPVLHYAILSGKSDFVAWLLDSGASPHSDDGQANSPLHVATRIGNPEVVLTLLKRGCQPNARNLNGDTPLSLWMQAVRDPPVLLSTICILGIFGARADYVQGSDSIYATYPHLLPTAPLERFLSVLFPAPIVETICPAYSAAFSSFLEAKLDTILLSELELLTLLDRGAWMPDAASDRCTVCLAPFTAFFRRHHCRNCHRLVCHRCSTKRVTGIAQVPALVNDVRVCDGCFNLFRMKHFFSATKRPVRGEALQRLLAPHLEQPSAPAVEGARDDVPEGFEYPAQSVIPQLSDLGDVAEDTLLSVGVQRLFDALFATTSAFQTTLAARRNYRELVVGHWDSSSGTPSRIIRYTMPSESSAGLPIIETQQIIEERPHLLVVVDVFLDLADGSRASFPGARHLRLILSYCTPGTTRLRVSFQNDLPASRRSPLRPENSSSRIAGAKVARALVRDLRAVLLPILASTAAVPAIVEQPAAMLPPPSTTAQQPEQLDLAESS